eukprot:22864-Rhodomonas_salina.5
MPQAGFQRDHGIDAFPRQRCSVRTEIAFLLLRVRNQAAPRLSGSCSTRKSTRRHGVSTNWQRPSAAVMGR